MLTAKEIFALRREHRHAEALVAAQELYDNSPDDPWSIRPLGWCFHDELFGCKKCNYPGRTHVVERQKIVAQFAALPIPPEDDLLLKFQKSHVDPLAEILQVARRDQDEGRLEDARARLVEALPNHRTHPQLNEQLAWVLWRVLLQELKKDAPDPKTIRELLGNYSRLQIAKPSDIHARIVGIAARAASHGLFPSFCRFLQWWDPKNYREQDFAKQQDGEKQFDSLVEQTIRGVAKTFEDEQDHAAAHAAAEFLLSHADRYPDQEWFPYYTGEALLWLGRVEEARKRLLPVLRVKSGEFWAWHILARTFPSGDTHRLSCLCKALSCSVKGPEFLLNVRLDLAKELLLAGHPDLARHEVQRVVEIRQTRGWAIRGRVREFLDAAWFTAASAREDSAAFATWADNAQETLTEDLPWMKAVLAVPHALLGKDQKPGSIIDVATDTKGLITIPVRRNMFPALAELPSGSALDIRIALSGDHPRVVALRERIAEPWDILPTFSAIVEHVNRDKGVTMLLIADGRMARAYHSDVENSSKFTPGKFVNCRIVEDRGVSKVRWLAETEHLVRSSCWQIYAGEFRPREKGGGHVGAIFVPARLTSGISLGSSVGGVAVQRMDRDTQRSWWEAITAESPS